MAEPTTVIALSGSTNGAPIHLTGTNSAGAHAVHTATAASKGYDRVTVYGNNQDASAVVVTFELGGTGVTKNIEVSVEPDTAMAEPLLRGIYMRAGLTLEAFAATTAVINLIGFVERHE